ncbi:ATP phosphoribosyltransferase regulatory subunit [Caloranaerobacter ferrireducens]|uniref:ATP phosphoribosyltransferase regulatory subunit n=1 Tax=Caloranaerobacter ferrireducens TaxID=1323370 RepID=UPI00084DE839|nr:ATP phosphoribosyltransferase regulatory subunit [Caloranaerobacter ferrireducens]
MLSFKYQTPHGVRYELYNDYEIKEIIIKGIKDNFRSYGYKQVSTPTIEYYDVFSLVKSTVLKDEMFKFIDSSGEILVLRPDVTIPIARMVANNYKTNKDYFKFFYVSKVFRMSRNQNGKEREITQAGIEYFGNNEPDADAEVIAIAIKSLLKNVSNFQIEIGHTDFYKGLLSEIDIDRGIQDKLKGLIENKNFVEIERLLDNLDIKNEVKDIIKQLPGLYGEFSDVLKKSKKMCLNDRMARSLENLEAVYEILNDYGYSQYISIDLGLINHLDYYTGIIFKGYMANHGQIILNGGRYDKLTEQYGHCMPATGFAINIDELLNGIKSTIKKLDKGFNTDYLILYTKENRKEAFKIANYLRNEGLIVETDLYKNLKKHIDYAESNKIKTLIIYGTERLKLIDIQKNNCMNIDIDNFMKRLDNKVKNYFLTSIH